MKIRIKIFFLYLCMIAATAITCFVIIRIIHYKNPFDYGAKASDQGFQIKKDGTWEDFYVKGINIGAALPGKWFTEFPEEEEIYLGWFEQIGEMNANCIRVYTLLPSQFYSALETYNKKHPDQQLWLLQEIWPEENPEDQDYLKKGYIENYYSEIKNVVDAIHGNARIEERVGRAYGVYTSDVTKYVLGYLVGRELEPEEILSTNKKHKGFIFQGDYLSSTGNASPSEAWLTMNCDYVLTYEEEKYSTQHPVAIVSWPTLDVKEHSSEWNTAGNKSLEYNDKVSIDINHINVESKMKAGLFGAYHIYPNYPDFMNNESVYNNYYDEIGRLRYGGYLREFIQSQSKYPALVAEFGLATGMENAHTSPDGLNHGGLTEEQQGEGIVRMMKAIRREGYAGGLIFEWMDEWAKKTWTAEPFMIPYDRHAYWHNALDPEQNYGILAQEAVEPKTLEYQQEGKGVIQEIGLKHDAAFLYLTLTLDSMPDFDKQRLLIGLDTYDRTKGEYRFLTDTDITAPTGMEFLLDLGPEKEAKLLVQPGYNIAAGKYASYESSTGYFEEIKRLINNERVTEEGLVIPAIYEDGSQLLYGTFTNNSYYQWYIEGDTIFIRIPWNRLNFTDPSTMKVLDDNQTTGELTRDLLTTVTSEGILVSALLYDSEAKEQIDLLSTDRPFSWSTWDEPVYTERLKESYDIIKDYFVTME